MDDSLPIDNVDGIAYMVDHAGRIVSYGRSRWNAFAVANDAQEWCQPDNVIGLKLLDVVQGHAVRDAYRHLMGEILEGSQDGFAFGFRCDSPGLVREMRMSITAVGAQGKVTGLLFQSIVLHTEVRPPLDIFRFRDLTAILGSDEDRPYLTLCSYCQRVRAPTENDRTGEWISAENYYQRGGRSEVRITHGICQDCYTEILGRRKR
jgi:hypothetical protein